MPVYTKRRILVFSACVILYFVLLLALPFQEWIIYISDSINPNIYDSILKINPLAILLVLTYRLFDKGYKNGRTSLRDSIFIYLIVILILSAWLTFNQFTRDGSIVSSVFYIGSRLCIVIVMILPTLGFTFIFKNYKKLKSNE